MKTTSETIWLEHNKELNRFVLSKIKDKDIKLLNEDDYQEVISYRKDGKHEAYI